MQQTVIDKPELRILMLEDTQTDAELIEHELHKAGINFVSMRVETQNAFIRALAEFRPDIILSDYRLPNFDGVAALELVRHDYPEIPVIMVTGALTDIDAVELLHAGAKDYVLKDRLARLAPAVQRALSSEQGVRARKAAEEKIRKISESALDAIIMMGPDRCISFWNAAAERIFGYPAAEAVGQEAHTLLALPQAQAAFAQGYSHFLESGEGPIVGKTLQTTGLRKGGQEFPVELSISAAHINGQWHAVGIARDISERKQVEKALLDSEARYRRITEGLTDYQYTVRVENGRAVETVQSPACKSVTGYAAEEFALHPDLWIQMVIHADRKKVIEQVRQVMAGKEVPALEHRIIRKDGELRWVRDTTILFKDASGNLLSYDGVIKDITEHKKAEETIRNNEASLSEAQRIGHFGSFDWDARTDTIAWSDEYYRIYGFEPGQKPPGYEEHLQAYTAESAARLDSAVKRSMQTGEPYVIDLEHICHDGTQKWITARGEVKRDGHHNIIGLRGTAQDITERKLMEKQLLLLNRTHRALSAGNHALVHSENEQSLLENMCHVITEAGYVLAWVGYAIQDEKKSISPMAVSGEGKAYVESLNITWEDQPLGRGPTGTAIRTCRTQIVQDIKNDPRLLPWQEAAARYGYASSISLPLTKNGQAFGTLTIYAAEQGAFSPDQVALLEEMAGDLAFGINALRTRHERDLAMEENRQHIVQLQDSLSDTIRAIAGIVEMRDPYTAGHQIRVADLAAAIAQQMNLSEQQVHAIHLAGTVHDLGKIQVPAEILSKPGHISDIEFNLIKIHAQAGYDILKGIRFPWPIAQIVWQHHERLDGSGYPQGLRGNDILLEARILAVADVVEAMYSHRPYRPGLGLDKALAEIVRLRGICYDAQIVDTCVRLFQEQKFSFG